MAEFPKIEELFSLYLKGQCSKEQVLFLLQSLNMEENEARFKQLILDELENDEAADLPQIQKINLTNIFQKIREIKKDADSNSSSVDK